METAKLFRNGNSQAVRIPKKFRLPGETVKISKNGNQIKRTQKALDNFFLPLNIVDIDRPAAVDAAIIRAKLEKNGTPIGPYDLLIAGLARSRKMTLVTNNTKEF